MTISILSSETRFNNVSKKRVLKIWIQYDRIRGYWKVNFWIPQSPSPPKHTNPIQTFVLTQTEQEMCFLLRSAIQGFEVTTVRKVWIIWNQRLNKTFNGTVWERSKNIIVLTIVYTAKVHLGVVLSFLVAQLLLQFRASSRKEEKRVKIFDFTA